MKLRIQITILLLLLILGTGCNKEELNVNGLVLDYGNPSLDGCGWIIKIDKTEYSPINLDSDFQKDSLMVVLKYNALSSEWNCGLRKTGYQEIEIMEIRIRK